MASNQKDVQLVIRAKDEAKKSITAITAALKELSGSQDTVGKSAQKTDSLLSSLAEEFAQLERQVRALGALGKLAGMLDQAGAAVGRMDNAVKAAKGGAEGLIQEYGKASQSTQRLRQQAEAAAIALGKQDAATKAAKAELASIDNQVKQAERAYGTLYKTLQKTKAPTEELNNKLRAQRDTLIGLHLAQEQANSAYRQQADSLKQATVANREIGAALQTAERHQAGLRAQAVAATRTTAEQRRELGQLRGELSGVNGAVAKASQALGGITLTQESIADASHRASVEITKVADALRQQQAASRQGGAANQAAVPQSDQLRSVLASRQAFQQAQEQVAALGRELKNTAQPTEDLRRRYLLAQAAVKQANVEYQNIIGTLGRTSTAARGTFAAFDAQARAIQQSGGQLRTVATESNQAGGAISRLGGFLRQLAQAENASAAANRNANSARQQGLVFNREALSYTQRLRGEILALTTSYIGLYAAINQVGGVINAAQIVEATQSRLGVVFGNDSARIAEEMQYLRSEANRLGVSFETLGTSYSKISIAAKQANFTTAETRNLFTAVAEAARVNRTSVDDLNGVFRALEQMLSKGKIQAEELRGQLGDRMTGAFKLFADGLGVTTEQLDSMLKTGQVVADSDTLIAFANRLRAVYGSQVPEALESLTAQIGRFGNQIFEFQAKIAQAGFGEELRSQLAEINQELSNGGIESAAKTISAVLTGLLKTARFLADNIDLLIIAFKAFVAVKVGDALVKWTRSSLQFLVNLQLLWVESRKVTTGLAGMLNARLTASMAGLTAATAAFRASLSQLGAGFTVARAGMAATAAGAVVLRGVFTTVAAAARALWAALGGFPGLIIGAALYAVTEVVTRWLGSVEAATAALEQHQQTLERVRQAYNNASAGAKDLSKSFDGIRSESIKINTKELQKQLDALKNDLQSPVAAFGNDPLGTVSGIKKAVDAFKAGQISAKQFGEEINRLKKVDPSFNDGLVESFFKVEEQATALEEAIAKNEAQLRLLEGTATDADKALLGLAEAAEEVGAATDAKKLEKFNEALNEIKAGIPELAAEFERLKKHADLDAQIKQLEKFGELTAEATEAINRRRTAIDVEAFSKSNGSSGVERSVELLKKFEGFRDTAYFDVNAYRAGYGSDTITLADGSIRAITQGMKVSQEDAMRDLVRRIGDFQDIVKTQVGSERFGAFTPEQQAALTSIAYNYGSLPERIVAAVKSGSAEEMAKAVRALENDNGGVNRARRNAEADILAGAGPALQTQNTKAEIERREEAEKYLQTLIATNEERRFEIQNLAESARQQEINKALHEADLEATKKGIDLKSEAYQRERAQLAELTGQRWDAANKDKLASEEKAKVEKQVNDLLEQRKMLQEQLEYYQSTGDTRMAGQVDQQIMAVNEQLKVAIENAMKFWQALGGPEADMALLKLKNVEISVQKTGQASAITGKQINQMIEQGAASAFDNFAQKIANGENAMEALRDSFLQFASDFLREIAQMIIKKAIFNAIGGDSAGGGLGGLISGAIGSLFHTGGVVGTGGPSRAIHPAWFATAARYHTGGIAGLKPNEVPAILERGEEVLTSGDPRHIMNGGGTATQNIKVVNTFDAGSFVSEGLNSTVGEKALLNFVSANSGAVRRALGV